jgi:hypothetical protein
MSDTEPPGDLQKLVRGTISNADIEPPEVHQQRVREMILKTLAPLTSFLPREEQCSGLNLIWNDVNAFAWQIPVNKIHLIEAVTGVISCISAVELSLFYSPEGSSSELEVALVDMARGLLILAEPVLHRAHRRALVLRTWC